MCPTTRRSTITPSTTTTPLTTMHSTRTRSTGLDEEISAAWAAGSAATVKPAVESELSAVRAELNQQRRFRIQQLDELTADSAEAVATADEPRLQVTRALRIAAEAALGEIDDALRRLRDGSYGACEHCREAIADGRLEVLPTARLCTRCQYVTETSRYRRNNALPGTRNR
jgi:RNA polymerase-binding transcription factor DksA